MADTHHDVHKYETDFEALDVNNNVIGSGTTTFHTDDHHDNYGGKKTEGFTQHIHALLKDRIVEALAFQQVFHIATITYKDVRYVGKETSPLRAKLYSIIAQAIKNMARAYR